MICTNNNTRSDDIVHHISFPCSDCLEIFTWDGRYEEHNYNTIYVWYSLITKIPNIEILREIYMDD